MGKKKKSSPSHAVEASVDKPSTRSQAVSDASSNTWLNWARLAMVLAACLTLYLSLKGSSALPGCGPESTCDQVLSSHWGRWLGIPITLPGLVLYVSFLFLSFRVTLTESSTSRRAFNGLLILSLAILTGALWFVGVQAFSIGAFCPYCCSAHALASFAALLFLFKSGLLARQLGVRIAWGGALAVIPLSLVVVAGVPWKYPSHAQLEVVSMAPPASEGSSALEGGSSQKIAQAQATTAEAAEPDSGNQAQGEAVTELPAESAASMEPFAFPTEPFPVPNSGIRLDSRKLPTLGDPSAPKRFACLFDYTCHHCRQLHGYIRELLIKYEGKLSCTMVPMPLDAQCNPRMKSTPKSHQGACDYARICLAVQALAPEQYDAFDTWLFSDHAKTKPLSAVRAYAGQLVGEQALARSMESLAVQGQLRENIEVYQINSEKGGRSSMPQTMVGNSVVFGPPPNTEVLEKLLRDTLKF